MEIVALNEPAADAATSAHLLVFDSVHGRWDREVSADGAVLRIDGEHIACSRASEPGVAPWDDPSCSR